MQVQSLGREDPLEEGNPFQYSCLENFMDRGAWWATVHGVTKSQPPPKRLSRTHAWGHFLQPQQSSRGKWGWGLKLQKETLLRREKTAHPPHPITVLIN